MLRRSCGPYSSVVSGKGLKLPKGFRSLLVLLLALTLAVSAFALTGCAAEDDEEETTTTEDVTEDEEVVSDEPVAGGVFSYFIVEPAYISPTFAYESEGIQIVQATFDSLVDYDPLTSELRPAAADSWSSNDDFTVWTFNLNEDATFHNGDPVTAEDFVYAWTRMVNDDTGSYMGYHLYSVVGAQELEAGDTEEFAGLRAVDDHTLEVTLQYPYADFEFVVGHPDLGPIPKAVVEADPDAFDEFMVGNGPFMMSEAWAHDQYVKLEAYDGYYGDTPYIDGVEFKIFEDESTAFLEFEAGNLDFTRIPAGQLAAVSADYGLSSSGYTANPGNQVLTGPELGIYYILINNESDLFQDVNVRKALNLAINRQAISDAIYEGTRQPASSVSPKGILGWQDGLWPDSHYDLEGAKAALADAGYPDGDGFPAITLDLNTGSGHEDVFQLVQADLAAIGIESEISGTEWAEYREKMDLMSYDLGRYGWIADYPIMDNFLYPLMFGDSADNTSGYKSDEFDEAILAARQIADVDERMEAYADLERILGADMPVVPIMYYSHFDVASNRINDMTYSALNILDFTSVWISE